MGHPCGKGILSLGFLLPAHAHPSHRSRCLPGGIQKVWWVFRARRTPLSGLAESQYVPTVCPLSSPHGLPISAPGKPCWAAGG